MFTETIATGSSPVEVVTTDNGGHQPEFWAKRASTQIIQIADTAHPAIREQALAFKDQVEQVILYYMKKAIECDRTTVGHLISEAGQPKLAELLRRA